MTQRRPHWDDDLIEAVRHNYNLQMSYADEEEALASIYDIIAAVEDWEKWEHVPKGTLRRMERQKAAIQQVREVLDENDNSYVTKAKIRRALDGES